MLKTAGQGQRAERKKAKFDVEIASVATAVPKIESREAQTTKRAREVFPHLARLKASMAIPGLETRYACEAPDSGIISASMDGRRETAVFQRHALDLLEEVALEATKAASVGLENVGALVVNTITGLAIPSLDAKLMNRLQLPHSVERLPIFGLGCGGGVGGRQPAPPALRKPCRWSGTYCFSTMPPAALPAHRRSEYRNVCGSRAVWRWGGGAGPSQHSGKR